MGVLVRERAEDVRGQLQGRKTARLANVLARERGENVRGELLGRCQMSYDALSF